MLYLDPTKKIILYASNYSKQDEFDVYGVIEHYLRWFLGWNSDKKILIIDFVLLCQLGSHGFTWKHVKGIYSILIINILIINNV